MSRRPIRIDPVGDEGDWLVSGTDDINTARAALNRELAAIYPGEDPARAEDRVTSNCRRWRWVPTDKTTREWEGWAQMLHDADSDTNQRGTFPGVLFYG